MRQKRKSPERPPFALRRHLAGHLVAATLSAPLLLATPIATAGPLVPHAAGYDLTLEELRLGGRSMGAQGHFALRLERRCGSWILSSRLDFRIAFGDGRNVTVGITYRMRENIAGTTLSFESRSQLNGRSTLETRGTATMPEDGSAGRAIFTMPERREFVLPPGTLFPMAALRREIALLVKGHKVVSQIVFDGSLPEGAFRVTDVATPGRLGPPPAPAGDAGLADAPSWRVESAWFRLGRPDTGPFHTMLAQIHENGVVSAMRLDLGLATAKAVLTGIERLPDPDC